MITNRVIMNGEDWVLIDVSTPKHPNSAVLMDTVDFIDLPERKVCINKQGYPLLCHNYDICKLHKLVVNYDMTDHKNRVRTDCRKSNLRPCTQQQNSFNTGAKGVYWHKRRNKWHARLEIDGKVMHLGYFDLEEDALEARRLAEIKHHGEFAKGVNI